MMIESCVTVIIKEIVASNSLDTALWNKRDSRTQGGRSMDSPAHEGVEGRGSMPGLHTLRDSPAWRGQAKRGLPDGQAFAHLLRNCLRISWLFLQHGERK